MSISDEFEPLSNLRALDYLLARLSDFTGSEAKVILALIKSVQPGHDFVTISAKELSAITGMHHKTILAILGKLRKRNLIRSSSYDGYAMSYWLRMGL